MLLFRCQHLYWPTDQRRCCALGGCAEESPYDLLHGFCEAAQSHAENMLSNVAAVHGFFFVAEEIAAAKVQKVTLQRAMNSARITNNNIGNGCCAKGQ